MYADARTPKETFMLWESAGIAKSNASYFKTFGKAVLAGMLLSMGGALALKVGGGSPLLASQNPGLNSLVLALVFPIGLVAIVLTGADLVTANMAIFMVAHAKRKVAWYAGIVNLAIVTLGNVCGSLLVARLFVKASGLYIADPYRSFVINFATAKVVPPTFAMVVVRGIGCNFLVCIAVYQAASAREVYSKIIAAYLPILVFVGIGLDHFVANALYIPAALMLGGTTFTTSDYIVKQMIAPWIGNLIGAAFFVMPMAYGYLYDDEMEMILPGPGSTIGSHTPMKKESHSATVSLVD